MIKYIVTWIVINTYSVPCPVQPPFEDEYGRIIQPTMELAIACIKSDSVLKTKTFSLRKQAEDFINQGRKDSLPIFNGFMWPSTNSSYLANFKLDSVKIKTQ